MSQLDADDVPKTSSTGAQRRLTQLIVQLPSQDLAAKYCRQLHGADQQQLDAFEEFRRSRDAEVIDVARLTAAIKHTAVRVSHRQLQWHYNIQGGPKNCTFPFA